MLKLLNSKATKNLFYVQFPDGLPPAEIYGGTWRAHYENEGAFFRTPGGNAAGFKAGVQEDAMRNLTGHFSNDLGGTAWLGVALANGVFRGSNVVPNRFRPNVGTYTHFAGDGGMDFDASLQVPTANEFRPRNRTIRIWECVEG